MLKNKKNIAMVMAAATVATSVAPVFAAIETQKVDEAALIAEVTKLLNTRYTDSKETGRGGIATDAYENSVYEITTASSVTVKSVSHLKELIEGAKVAGTTLELTVVDKGHKTVDGKIVGSEYNKYVKYNSSTLAADLATLTSNTAVVKSVEVSNVISDVNVVTLTSGEVIELTVDDYVLDLTTGLDADGNEIDLSNAVDNTVGKKVVGFKTNVATGATETLNDLPQKYVTKLVLGMETIELQRNLTDFVVEDGYTETGAELVNTLVGAKGNDVNVVSKGKEYTISQLNSDITKNVSKVVVSKEDGYEFTIELSVVEKGKAKLSYNNVKIVIKDKTQSEISKLRNYIVDNGATAVQPSTVYSTLAGESRFETAVEISKKSYPNKTNAVVLVGEDAIVDGLAAAPLAKQKKAPVLLAKKDTVTTETMNEIKRVINKGDTVYIVGGKSVISEDVEAQLIKEMNVKIVRLAGDDRYETSLKIAGEMNAKTQAYIVGGDGEADAMSIAAIASIDELPIIVTPADGLSKDAKFFLKSNSVTNVDVIGGESKVSTQVLKDLKDASITNKRIAGETRHETNAAVIDTYTKAGKLVAGKDVYVAKDGYVEGNGKLIDALAVAPLAGKDGAPIVLATEELSTSQNAAVKALKANGNKLTKVGNGISSKVMQKLVSTLGLSK